MISRQAGRRVASTVHRKKTSGGIRQAGRRDQEALRPKERRQLLQLVLCGGIFVTLVAVKLLLPAQMSQINQTLTAALERNIDVQTVFSAVGQAFSGEEDVDNVADQIYQAVFRPGTEDNSVMNAAPAPVLEDTTVLEGLRSYRMTLHSESSGRESETGSTEQNEPAYVLYSDQNLPEDVSLEQAVLGFDYSAPVRGVISSDFGYRDHPTAGEEKFHYGVDLAADAGSAISCFADGTVTAVGESSSYGKYCIVKHQNDYSTLYAHCSRITVSSGSNVKQGEKIGEVGETGTATGPHLHFELQRNSTYLNPVYYVGKT